MQEEMSENLLRHVCLSSFRSLNAKFRSTYGRLVLACDGGQSWRRGIFPQYKASRKKDRDKSFIDWKELFRLLELIKQEIRENVPWRVVQQEGAEADDVIAVLTESCVARGEPVMIVSGDHDFIQLHRPGVKQYSPRLKKLVTENDPRKYLYEQVVKGCTGDGVPNILSPDNTFTDSIRQKSITEKILKEYTEKVRKFYDGDYRPEGDELKRFERNSRCIDFACIPPELRGSILARDEYAKSQLQNNVMNYLIKNRCAQLLESAEDFQTKDLEEGFIG